ncbi:uncharacterized protein LOC114730690 isoform X1 [Neltuma alba]|uniref:uncharacterized protein LOC114730690 isoform X1 n=1 Tax=Neltuma alba TaxID=207710 RepID=UPI0010A59BC4|nr:uncharacterized protein LOC114730690 isoform X1 [Prosopis alba]
MAVLAQGLTFNLCITHPKICYMKQLSCFPVCRRLFANKNEPVLVSRLSRIKTRSFKYDDKESYEASRSKDMLESQGSIKNEVHLDGKEGHNFGIPFLALIAVAMGIAVTATLISIYQQPILGSSFVVQSLSESSSSSMVAPATAGFSFQAFGYKIILPEYAPGWIYFWLLMAAGCGLFISEEALNVWVGISLSRFLSLDGTWRSFAESFSRNSSYVISTVFWVYWGVCISDMVPFYLGKLFRRSGVSDDVSTRLGIGKEKALEITKAVQKYGNLIGFVERFSLGVRNPTAFLAGAMGISPELFFAGVCCGGLFTLPLQLGVGFLLRERPMFALATVATVMGIWTIFPYALAGLTALFFYLRRRSSA